MRRSYLLAVSDHFRRAHSLETPMRFPRHQIMRHDIVMPALGTSSSNLSGMWIEGSTSRRAPDSETFRTMQLMTEDC